MSTDTAKSPPLMLSATGKEDRVSASTPSLPRQKAPRMTPRPRRAPKAAPPVAAPAVVVEAPPVEVLAAPNLRQPWERYSDALCILIAREGDELERYLMRIALLKARYTPWRTTNAHR